MQNTFGKGIFDNEFFEDLTSKRNSTWYSFITICIIIIVIIFIIYWCCIRPKWYEEINKN